jgi:NADH-quinone oxidoreductase subunit M
VMFGPVTHEENKELKDLNARELLVLAPMIVAIFAMGIFPNFFFAKLSPSIDRLIQRTGAVQETAIAGRDNNSHALIAAVTQGIR